MIQAFQGAIRAAVVSAFLCVAGEVSAALKGAIFTTDRDGTIVNGNIYQDCCDVFLNGGPPSNAPCWAAGLPNGEYYFQVTDPSGHVLLSLDDIEQRRFVVAGGLIVQYLGASGDCQHELGLGKCNQSNSNNITIQLMPFATTPNPGGVYKAWVTRVQDYNPNAPNSKFGFKPNASKTDNFKCAPSAPPPPPHPDCRIIVRKYRDYNANGQNDGEPPMDGVMFDVCYTPPGQSTATCVTVTSGDWAPGQAKVDVPSGSEVIVCEHIPFEPSGACEWVQTQPHADTPDAIFMNGQWCYLIQTGDCPEDIYVRFGNVCMEPVCGAKSTAFWTQKSGENTLKSHGPTWANTLNALSLRAANGSHRDFKQNNFKKNYSTLRSWLVNQSNANVAYSLSRQVTTTIFNVKYKGLDKNSRVIINDTLAQHLGITSNTVRISDALAWAERALKIDGQTTPSSLWGKRQKALTILLAQVNANAAHRTVDGAGVSY